MKVFLNREVVVGPWGGGNRTLKTLIERLVKRGHEYTFNYDDLYDVIYCHDPRPNSIGLRYEHLMHIRKNKKTPIFQRVGDVFYHRSASDTSYLKETLKYSDAVTFISSWAADFLEVEIDNVKNFIHELRPPSIFYREIKDNIKKKQDKFTILTHHWSANPLKGLAFYQEIDKLLSKNKYDKVQFYYLGRTNENFKFKNTIIIPPVDVDSVIDYLDLTDAYVTASKNETGGNHVVEALARGCNVLYHKHGGGISSICNGIGTKYETIDEFENILDQLISENRQSKRRNIELKFSKSLEEVCDEYIDIMERLNERK